MVDETRGEAIIRNIGEGEAVRQSRFNPLADPMINDAWIDQSQRIIDRIKHQQ